MQSVSSGLWLTVSCDRFRSRDIMLSQTYDVCQSIGEGSGVFGLRHLDVLPKTSKRQSIKSATKHEGGRHLDARLLINDD